MRICFFILLIIDSFYLNAQSKVTKYYDANWMEVSKDKAVFYADFIKEGNNYNCTSYWINTTTVRGKSTFPNTVMQFPIGIQVLYFKNGHIEDSSLFENKEIKYSYHHYSNNQLAVHYYVPDNKNEGIAEGYDEAGNKIKHYIFQKEADFKGGPKAWVAYINKNATLDLPVKGDSTITAKVQVEFIVDENGDVLKPKILKSSGYKSVDNDALRLIANSPQWNYGILYNKPIKSYKIQPISYILKPEKK
jgi:protein TonB